jgi:sugar lactone lactonase YvrE
MKSALIRRFPSLCQRSRQNRLCAAVAVLTFSTVVSWAQTVGISTVAGQAGSSALTDNAVGTSARFYNLGGLASDGTSIFVADTSNNAIRKVLIATGAVSTLATGFSFPGAVAVDGVGVSYVADSSNHAIRMVTGGGVVSVTAGSLGVPGASVPSTTRALARFNSPQGIAVNSAGTFVYVADTGNNVVRRIDILGDVVTEIASGFKPWGLALNAAGTILYATDYNGHTVRSIAVGAGNTLATVAGTVDTSGSTDSPALFKNPAAISIDSAGDLYVADTGNHTIRKIVGGTVTTLAGAAGVTGALDAIGAAARFSGPAGIVATGVNTLYIADTNNHALRRAAVVTAPGISSANTTTFTVGTPGTFTVVATGSPASIFSIISGSLPPNITLNATTGVISGTPTTGAGSPYLFTVRATNGVNPPADQAFTLTVNQPPTITSANNTTFSVGAPGSFSVTATGSPTITYSVIVGALPAWASLNSTTGLISGTPNNNSGSPFNITLQASNGVGAAATQAFTLTVSTGPAVSTHPAHSATLAGQTATFTVVASGTPAPTYLWERQPAAGGGFAALSEGGTYSGVTGATLFVNSVSSAMSGDQFRVRVENGVGPAVYSTVATLTMAQLPVITSSAATTFVVNQAGTFTVTATGTPAPTFSVTSGSLPAWATLDGVTGIIAGTPLNTSGSPFSFQLTATNGINPASTQSFVLSVSLADLIATISTQPVSATVNVGQNATFTGAATGTPAPTLRWQRQPSGTSGFINLSDDQTYSGTTDVTLIITNVTAGMTGDQFRLVATNTGNSGTQSATSTAATLTVNIGTAITTFAGLPGSSGTANGTGTAARFNTPASIAIDAQGNFYVADSANHVVRKINSAGVVTTLAGLAGSGGYADGIGSAARFSGPSAVAVDASGNVYVADTYNHVIRVISAEGTVATLAGLANTSGSADGVGSLARFAFPSGIAVDINSVLYVADSFNHTIRRIGVGATVSTLAGSAGIAGNTNGLAVNARFSYPNGIAVSSGGVLYVADSVNHLIRQISVLGDVSTLAGGAGLAGSTDANGTAARFNQPTGVAVDNFGNVFVSDTYNHTIRKITMAGDVTTLAGLAGVSGLPDGIGSVARFNQPFDLVVDANGSLYIADTRNNAIRRSGTTTAPVIQTEPQNRTVPAGGSTTFAVVATGVPDPSYQWQLQAAGTTGFVNLANTAFYSGVTTATLTLSNVLSSSQGDAYRVFVTNGINPAAISSAASITIGEAPVITSANSAAFRALQPGTFTLTASGTPAPTFLATGLPNWLLLNPATGVLSGTPPEDAVGDLAITLFANNGGTVSQAFTLTITPANVAPAITTQPVAQAVNQGQPATFSVVASGALPVSYQWRRNGVGIMGATGASFTVANAQPANAGNYSVSIMNSAGAVISNAAELVVNTLPVFNFQPRTQTVLAGASVTFGVGATGATSFTYQWRKNGVAILGATNPSLTLIGTTAADAGVYDAIVTNAIGSSISSVAQLMVVTAPTAPIITASPAPRTVLVGTETTFSVSATGAPAPGYQWRKNGTAIAGAIGSSLTLPAVQSSDAASYDVVVTNSMGSVTSAAAGLRVIARSFAGVYFGSFSGGIGNFALYIRDDNTGVFLGYLPANVAPVMSLNILVADNGTFGFSQSSVTTAVAPDLDPARSAALNPVAVVATIGTDGSITGGLSGGATASLTGSAAPQGATQNAAGFYQTGASESSTRALAVAGPNGEAFAVILSGAATDGGPGFVNNVGLLRVITGRSIITLTINPTSGEVAGSSTGVVTATLRGGSEAELDRQRIVNISTRARVGTGDEVAIAGFVITGQESKPVLIRAVGPTLATAFQLSGALASPRLELFQGTTSLAVNSGIAGNRVALDAAAQRAGAFALGAAGTDAAILITLAPGNYTAIVSSTTATAGVALVEVYDLSAPGRGQKLLNISTRASAGTAENTLIAGFVVPAGVTKRVLIRGVGPGLTSFGVAGALAQPSLSLTSGGTTIAQNTNWATSPDSAVISAASLQVGAFGLATNDSAMVVTLVPGNYTAQVVGVGGATGVALIEVYELP